MKYFFYATLLGVMSSLSAMEQRQLSPRRADLVDLVALLHKDDSIIRLCPFAGKSIYVDYRLAQGIVSVYESARALHPGACLELFQGYLRENQNFNTGGKAIVQFNHVPANLISFLCGLQGINVQQTTLTLDEALAPLTIDSGALHRKPSKKRGGK